MTAAFWVLFVGFLLMSLANVRLSRSHQRLAALNEELSDLYDRSLAKHREFRAAYRDLIGDFTKLHTKYKAMGGRDA